MYSNFPNLALKDLCEVTVYNVLKIYLYKVQCLILSKMLLFSTCFLWYCCMCHM